jgi:GcrA cell cycle regulator
MSDFWDDATIDRLRHLWNQTGEHYLSTADIGRQLGISKNAVVGAAHRQKLRSRPSPIRHRYPNAPPPAHVILRAPTETLPPLASLKSPLPVPVKTEPTAPKPPAPAPAPRVSGEKCCFPLGDPGTKSFRFCGSSAAARRPYCDEHVEIAFRRPVNMRAAAAR